MSGFTASVENGSKTGAACYGANHHDSGTIGRCDSCGDEVVKTDKGHLHNVVRRGTYQARSYACWSTHRCEPEQVANHARHLAEQDAQGIVRKGSQVEVFKGRKVPVGTTGKVFWLGEDGYGTAKVGLVTEAGEKHFTAESNVRTVTTKEA